MRTHFNPKRIMIPPFASLDDSKHRLLQELEQRANYGGNPLHKKNPGDFGLSPPADPRPDKTLCDGVAIFRRIIAVQLLREGFRRGMVSVQERNGWPQNVWVVTQNQEPLEAQLENAELGTYHGYPMPASDPFREKVLHRWQTE